MTMKRWVIILAMVGLLSGCQSQSKNTDSKETLINEGVNSMYLTIQKQEFLVHLEDNPTVDALLSFLPLTITMKELNGNEKYCYLENALPSNAITVGDIQAGDLMLFGDTCLVLFYESFSSTYAYTKIGYVEGIEQLHQVIGKGNIEVCIK